MSWAGRGVSVGGSQGRLRLVAWPVCAAVAGSVACAEPRVDPRSDSNAVEQTETRRADESTPQRDGFRQARERLVDRQIEARGVSDPKGLAAMRKAPRHRFGPRSLMSRAHPRPPLPPGRLRNYFRPATPPSPGSLC